MLVHAKVPMKYHFHFYREAFKTATELDGLVMVNVNSKKATQYQHMFGGNLRLFGEARNVKMATRRSVKLANRGVPCMMVGYAENHDSDVYHMWNPVTQHVHVTRDII